MTPDTTELPCSNCGSLPMSMIGDDDREVICLGCGRDTGWVLSAEAVEAWNRLQRVLH